jgi:hypothetical protein
MNYIKCPKCGEEDPAFDYAHVCGPVEVKRKVMNERIKELAGQAKFMAEEDINKQISYNTELKAFAEKFAELIVEECAKIAVFKDSGTVATADVAGHMAAGRSIAARLIKEHFEVEE